MFDRYMRTNEEHDSDDGRCKHCGGLLSMVYPNKRNDKGAYLTCKDDTCKEYLKHIERKP